MQKNSQNFSMQDAMRLANSEAGQRLLAILKQSGGDQLQQAMEQASSGHYETAQQSLRSLLENSEVRALLKELGG